MAKIVGWSGTATVGGSDYEIKSWTFDYEQERIEVSHLGSQNREYLTGGLVGGSGSLEGDLDATIVAAGTYPAPFGTSAALVLNINDTHSITGTALFDKYQVKKSVEGAVTWSCDYVFNGAITWA